MLREALAAMAASIAICNIEQGMSFNILIAKCEDYDCNQELIKIYLGLINTIV